VLEWGTFEWPEVCVCQFARGPRFPYLPAHLAPLAKVAGLFFEIPQRIVSPGVSACSLFLESVYGRCDRLLRRSPIKGR
jgi:hypothetical protein